LLGLGLGQGLELGLGLGEKNWIRIGLTYAGKTNRSGLGGLRLEVRVRIRVRKTNMFF
jgi:hypothetical protein